MLRFPATYLNMYTQNLLLAMHIKYLSFFFFQVPFPEGNKDLMT